MLIKLNAKSDAPALVVGGKGLNLIKLSNSGFQVPEGFVVTTEVFKQQIAKLKPQINQILASAKVDNLAEISSSIEKLIAGLKLSKDLERRLISAFEELNLELVAVRSSAASEDGAGASWAGQLSTKLNTTKPELIDAIKACWASAYSQRALLYAITNNFDLNLISVAVIVQKMIQSEVSGVAFSINPLDRNADQVVIEAVYGLGEAIVSGSVTPDQYAVNVKNFGIEQKYQEDQTKQLSLSSGGTKWVDVDQRLQTQLKLSDKQIVDLAKIIKKIEAAMGYKADVEWAIEVGIFYITQSRPITTLNSESAVPASIFKPGIDLFRWGPTSARYFFIGDYIENCFKFFGTKLNLTYVVFHDKSMVWVSDNDAFRKFCIECFEILISKPELVESSSQDFNKACETVDQLYSTDVSEFSSLDQAESELVKLNNVVSTFWKPTLLGEMANYGSELYIKKQLFEAGYSSKDVTRIMEVMTTPEQASFLQQLDDKIRHYSLADIGNITRDYNWLENGYGGVKNLDEEYFIKLKNQIGSSDKNFQKGWIPKLKLKKQKAIEQFKLSQGVIDQFKLLTRLMIEQDIRKMYMMKLQAIKMRYLDKLKMLPKFEQLSLNLSLSQIIEAIKKGGPTYEVTSEFGYSNEGGRLTKLNAQQANSVWYHYGSEKTASYGKVLEGITASYGVISKVTSLARVIEAWDGEEAKNFKQGEVLVTTMTTPEYLSLMQKASAIVTDVGGLTSHAAIVARELGKPCIVGTKVATKIIKTGDAVFINTHTSTVEVKDGE